RRNLRPELDDHLPFGGLDNGDFLRVRFGRAGLFLFLVLLFSFFLVGLSESGGRAQRKNRHTDWPESLHSVCVPRSNGVVTLRFFERQFDDPRQALSFRSEEHTSEL